MSLVNWRAISNTLNVLMQNWMQNSHAAITGHKKWERSHLGCILDNVPYTQGLGPEREGLVGCPQEMPCIQYTDTCHPSSSPDGGLLLWTSRQGMKSHRSGHQLQLEGRHSAARGQAQFPDALILLGSNSAHAYRGSPCAAEQGSTAAWLGCSTSTKGQQQHLLPILTEVGCLAGPGTATLNLCVNARITPKHLCDPCIIHN